MTLPVASGIVNRFLDNASNPVLTTFSHQASYLAQLEVSMLAALNELDQLSTGVEARFNELLGPNRLTSAGIPDPNPEPLGSWGVSI